MRIFLPLMLCVVSFGAYADQSQQQQEMKQAYQEFVQIDTQIESLLKQKLELEAEVAQHTEREESSIRPRVDRRQGQEIQELSQQIQSISQQISQLDKKRSAILQGLSKLPNNTN